MTHFEYVFVAVSILLSFTILRLLDALPSAFGRERGYWVPAVWVLFLLSFCAQFWWLNWANRGLGELSYRYYLFLLLAPAILFLTATALVSASPADVPSWREHFRRHRRGFFGGAFVYLGILTVNSYVTFAIPLLDPMRAWQTFTLALIGAGFVSDSERAQTWIAGAAALALFVSVGLSVALGGEVSLERD